MSCGDLFAPVTRFDLWHGDCLELMRDIPDGSVDMILCDPPYGTVKGMALDGWSKNETEWDEVLDTELK